MQMSQKTITNVATAGTATVLKRRDPLRTGPIRTVPITHDRYPTATYAGPMSSGTRKSLGPKLSV